MAHLNLLSPRNFSNSDTDFGFLSIQHLHLKNILHTSPKEYCSLFHLLVPFSLCAYTCSQVWKDGFSGYSPFSCKFILFASLSAPGGWPWQPVSPRVLFTFWLLVGFSQWKDRRWKEKKREHLGVFIPLVLSLLWWICSSGCVLQLECPLSQIGATLFPSLFLHSWGWWRLPAVPDSWVP